jgi:hypothetical protein
MWTLPQITAKCFYRDGTSPATPQRSSGVIRTAIVLFAIVLFVAWYVHVVNRADGGTGFKLDRFLSELAFTATVTGALFVLLVTWALVGVYVRHVRGLPVGIISVLGPPLFWWTVSCVAAFFIGVVLAEWYAIIDEIAFERQARRHLAAAEARTDVASDSAPREQPHYTRVRWWPAGSRQLESRNH